MSIFDKNRKGMIFMAKLFNRNVDGPFNGDHKMYTRLDRKYVKNRLEDALIAAGTGDLLCEAFALDDDSDYYVVYVNVKNGSKKHEVMRSLGFVETKAG